MLTSLLVAARAGVAAMRANPVRALLATLGVVIGSAALVAVLAVSDGVEQYARMRVAREGFDRLTVRPIVYDTLDGQRIARAEIAALRIDDLRSVGSVLIPGETATLAVQGVALADVGNPVRSRAVSLRGIAIATPDTTGPALAGGRRLTPEESLAGTPVVVVGPTLARAMRPDSARPLTEAIGDSLVIAGRTVRVIGVIAPEQTVDARGTLALVAPLALAEAALAHSTGARVVPSLTIRASRAEEVLAMRQRVERWLVARDPQWRSSYRIEARAESQLLDVQRGLLIFRLLMGSITGITLAVGGIGIMNVLLASVAERTREIGVRKVVGARRRDILLQFLAESVTIAGAGSAIGTALGLTAAYGVTALMRAQTQAVIFAATTWQTLLVSAALALVVGVVFGCYPAARAARLAPIDAIHTE